MFITLYNQINVYDAEYLQNFLEFIDSSYTIGVQEAEKALEQTYDALIKPFYY
jgi:cell division septum initiation protein DivIVA